MKSVSYSCPKCGARTSKSGNGHVCIDRKEVIAQLIKEGKLPKDYKEKEDAETLLEQSSQSISSELSDNSNTSDIGLPNINNFQDFGLTANFAGEILKEVDGWLFGYVKNGIALDACKWHYKRADCVIDGNIIKEYNLTPIKKHWYDDPANFPALVIGSSNPFVIDNLSHLGIVNVKKGTLRLATKAERDVLYAGEEH